MRICLVSQEYPPGYVGGIGTQTRVKARGLLDQGHDVEVLTAGEESGPALATRVQEGVTVHALRPPGGSFALHSTEAYWLGYTWAVLGALRSLGQAQPFDVVDFPDYAAEGLAYQLDRPEDEPTAVVVHLHGSLGMFSSQIGWPPPDDPLLRIGMFMEDSSVETADGLLAASRSLAELTAARLEIDPARIAVVAGAVDSEFFTPAAARAAQGEQPRLLFVGNLVVNKGVETVLEAFVRLSGEYPGLTLTVAGSDDGEVAERLRSRAAQAGVAERVEVLGFVEHEELPALYRSADVFAAPSRYEGGLGLVYLEAMACGLPVVATAAGGAAEAIEHGETGLLMETGDVEETTAAIGTLLADPALRARMTAAGPERVRAHFTQARYAEKVSGAYERAIERRRRARTGQTADPMAEHQ
jgi:glycosyltransferase involved in cell wall biosynthesis